VLPIPAAEHPFVPDNPELCFTIGRHDKVLSYASGIPNATCTMTAGQHLFFTTVGGECSSAEPVPFFGATEAEQRACIKEYLAGLDVVAIRLSLDGGPQQNIFSRRFLVLSKQGETVFPEDPIFEAEPGPATFVAADYAATTRRQLRPGQHTIALEIEFTENTATHVLTLNVVRSHDQRIR
jgi:hypothetical protein